MALDNSSEYYIFQGCQEMLNWTFFPWWKNIAYRNLNDVRCQQVTDDPTLFPKATLNYPKFQESNIYSDLTLLGD